MRDYGRSGSLSAFQEDHLISLELGGHPTDPRNLWPQPYPRATDVDQEENRLNDLVLLRPDLAGRGAAARVGDEAHRGLSGAPADVNVRRGRLRGSAWSSGAAR
jgi:hypothetical protein